MANFYLLNVPQWFSNSGVVLSGGKIYTYSASSTTPLAAYSDSTGTTVLSNPVILDSAGRGQIWLSAASYKFVIQTSAGVTLLTIDGYNPANINSTVAGLTDTSTFTMQQPTAATGSANQSSNQMLVQGRYWTGAADATDSWVFQNVIGAGSNPTSTFTVTHSGSSGTAVFSFPGAVSFGSVTSDVKLASGKVVSWNNDAGFSRTTAGTIAFGNGTQGDISGTIIGAIYQVGASDSGISRTAAKTFAFGDGTAGNATGTIKAAVLVAVESTAPAGVASSDVLYADSTDHRWKMKNNNGTAKLVSAGVHASQVFTANGTFTIPAGVTGVKFTIIAGGGAGGGATAGNGGAGGGAGGIAIKYLSGITPGNTIAVTVGAGGTGVSGSAGNGGGNSTIASGTEIITTVTANGGNGGSSGTVPQTGGNGGAVSTNGDINGYGASGAPYIVSPAGAMGGATMLGGNGNIAGGSTVGNAASANTGSGGSGAGAGASNAGGAGGSGIVIAEWVT